MNKIVVLALIVSALAFGSPTPSLAAQLALAPPAAAAPPTGAPPQDPPGVPRPVIVANGPSSPVPVVSTDSPARKPFTEFINSGRPLFVVPDGKRYVIEYVSAITDGGPDCRVNYVQLQTALLVDGEESPAFHFLPAAERLSDVFIVVGQLTRLYADPGTTVSADAVTSPNDCGAGFAMNLSGYVLDVP